MKIITAIFRHSSYGHAVNIRHVLRDVVQLQLYSDKHLDKAPKEREKLKKDIERSDFLMLNITSGGDMWDDINSFINTKAAGIPKAYIGANCADLISDEETFGISAVCNEYFTYGGKANLINMFKRAAVYAGADIEYESPRQIPWQGMFHPSHPEKEYPDIEKFFEDNPPSEKGNIGVLVSRGSKLNEDLLTELSVIDAIEKKGYRAVPVYTFSWPEDSVGAKGAAWCVENYYFDKKGKPVINGLIKMTNFFLKGRKDSDSSELLKRLNCPVMQPVSSYNMTISEWEGSKDGTFRDMAWGIALPELEGVIEPVFIGGKGDDAEDERRFPIAQRVEKLASRMGKWVDLSLKKDNQKKCVIMLNNNPCASVEASVGGGSKLDSLESTVRILKEMKKRGYDVGDIPESGEELVQLIMSKKAISDFRWTTVGEIVRKGGCLYRMTTDEYISFFNELPSGVRKEMTDEWGDPPGEEKDGIPPAMVYEDKICVTGVRFGNVVVAVQPKRGCAGSRCDGTVCRILHDPHCPPTHQYLASYRYFERIFGADFLIQVGTHGNLEFLPGKGTGLSDSCYPDICIGNMPNLYIYNADNPPEGTIAKRRALATIINHMQTVYTQSGLYDELEEIDRLTEQYEMIRTSDAAQAAEFKSQIVKAVSESNLKDQIRTRISEDNMDALLAEVHLRLTSIRNTQIQEGLHVFGETPSGNKKTELIYGILRYEGAQETGLRRLVCGLFGFDFEYLLKNPAEIIKGYNRSAGSVLEDMEKLGRRVIECLIKGTEIEEKIAEDFDYKFKNKDLLDKINGLRIRVEDISRRIDSTNETGSLLSAASGDFVPPGPSGVVTKGRDDIIPTGRNMYSLDPDTIPTKGAWITGMKLADAVIDRYLSEEGRYPESFGMYWMCRDIMWSGGEGMAQLLYMIGVRPVWMSNGRVKDFEVIPPGELKRPRIDVSVKLSGILRDNFKGRIELLDKAIRTVACLDEDEENNFLKKHTEENKKKGMSQEDAMTRIFGARPGTYINGISLQVYASSWKDRSDMVDVFTFFNGYSYGGSDYGKEAYKQLQNSLKTVDITYNKVMTDEQDMLGCSCYFGSQGGMTAAARQLSGKNVRAYFGDSRESENIQVRTMKDELDRIVQSKLFNPKWIEEMKKHGYKGASDISKRVERIYGWEATTDEVGDWVFDEITRTYIENENNQEFFKKNNPWALEEIERRLMEAYKRGLWQPADGLLDVLRDSYLDIEGVLEDATGDGSESFQGGSLSIQSTNDIEGMKEGFARMHEMLGGAGGNG